MATMAMLKTMMTMVMVAMTAITMTSLIAMMAEVVRQAKHFYATIYSEEDLMRQHYEEPMRAKMLQRVASPLISSSTALSVLATVPSTRSFLSFLISVS